MLISSQSRGSHDPGFGSRRGSESFDRFAPAQIARKVLGSDAVKAPVTPVKRGGTICRTTLSRLYDGFSSHQGLRLIHPMVLVVYQRRSRQRTECLPSSTLEVGTFSTFTGCLRLL